MPIVEIRDLRVAKRNRVICSLEKLSIEPGERVGILGPNGCGKSTLLRVIAGLERQFEGRCHVAVAGKQRVYVAQSPYLFGGTVLSNVSYGLRAHKVGGVALRDRTKKWIEKLGISHLAGSRPAHLSAGERKRTALARALAVNPRLLLLDEPFAELDPPGVGLVIAILAELKETTVLFAAPDGLPSDSVGREVHLDFPKRNE